MSVSESEAEYFFLNEELMFSSRHFKKKSFGTFIMKNLEEQIKKQYDKAYLDASLPASSFYEKLGYSTVRHEKQAVENGKILVYEVMEKIFL